MHKLWILALLLVVGFGSCKKSEKFNAPPGKFTIAVSREAAVANLSWTASTDLDGDQITYTIELEGNVLATGITNTSYQITGISANQVYKGRIIASDPKGLRYITPFEILLYIERVLLADNSTIKVFDAIGNLSWTKNEGCIGVPVISNDTVFAVGASSVYAAKLLDGTVLWSKNISPRANRSPVIHDGILYVEANGKLNALNTKDGATIWSINYVGSRDFTIGNDALYILTSFSGAATYLQAFNLKTGAIKWGDLISDNNPSCVIAKNGMVYSVLAPTYDNLGALFGYGANSGSRTWSSAFIGESLSSDGAGSPVIQGDVIYIPVNQGNSIPNKSLIVAINLNSGDRIWQTILPNNVRVDELAVNTTGVYACSNNLLFKLALNNGQLVWSKTDSFAGNITLTDENVFAAFDINRGTVMAYSLINGEAKLFTTGTGNYVNPPVIFKNGKVFYPANSPMSRKN